MIPELKWTVLCRQGWHTYEISHS